MSPLPNRPLQPPKSLAAPATEGPEMSQETPASEPTANAPVPQRPLMRPVARPQPPAPQPQPEPISNTNTEEPSESTEDFAASLRQQPIPAPSEPMQYRAIGLLRGRYQPSEEQFTRGEMLTADGTTIEAVLLGRVMSLVKNHLDLTQEHLWVVYPRTREKQEDLHVQIVGVWEPENLSKPEEAEAEETPEYLPSSEVEDNYFSIRGEIVYHSAEERSMIVKIQQAPRKKDDRPKAFKLQLKGALNGKALGYFWELDVRREGPELVVQDAKSIGMIPPRKRPKGFGGGRPRPGGDRGKFAGGKKPFRPKPGGDRPMRPGGSGMPPQQQEQPKRGEPLPKPVKRKREDAPTDPNNVTSEA